MNNYCIIVTPQAEEQIRDIAYYIAVDLQEPGAAELYGLFLDRYRKCIGKDNRCVLFKKRFKEIS